MELLEVEIMLEANYKVPGGKFIKVKHDGVLIMNSLPGVRLKAKNKHTYDIEEFVGCKT